MMGYYAIGIGGTGAKCLESLIHLAAAGMMPDAKEELYMLFVDPDDANGSLERAVTTLNYYKTFHNNEMLAQPSLLKTKIDSAENPIFSPFNKKDVTKPRLDGFFNFADLKLANNNAADLFEVLYSKRERETELDKGFRGHPSIGASVMAQTVLGGDEPWKSFRLKVAKDTNAKIFLVGSIFGGTGASGFPTIAKLIKDDLKDVPISVQIGGALVLPYFTFIDAAGDDQLKARAEYFLMNTQAALNYYHQWNKDLIYNAIYLLGDASDNQVDPSLGGKTQRNAQHFIELYAALAAVDFFGNDFADEDAKYFRLDRANNPLEWADIPDGNDGMTILSKLRQLTYFSFVYLDIYKQRLDEIRESDGRRGYDAPWYIDFFRRNTPKLSLTDDGTERSLNQVRDYCKDFLIWFANIQNSKRSVVVRSNPIDSSDSNDSFDLNKCLNLISSDRLMSLGIAAKNKLWDNMCQVKEKEKKGTDIGKFLHALYENCEKV